MIYNILIAIRWGKCLLPVYSITAIITIAAARILVQQWGIMGAALNYVLSCSILFVLFTLILVYVILRKKTSELIQLIQHPRKGNVRLLGLFFPGMFFIFLSDLCVEADTLVYFHSPITPTATASHAVVLSGFCRFVPFVDGMLSTALFLPQPTVMAGIPRLMGMLASVLAAPMYQGFHANGPICSICSLDNLAGFFLGTSRAPALCSKVTVMRSSSAEVSLSPLSAFTGTAPAVSPTAFRCHIIVVNDSCTLRT